MNRSLPVNCNILKDDKTRGDGQEDDKRYEKHADEDRDYLRGIRSESCDCSGRKGIQETKGRMDSIQY